MSEIKQILLEYLDNIYIKNVRRNITTTGRKATGKTQKKIRGNVIDTNFSLRGQVIAPGYIDNLETGKPPEPYNKALVRQRWFVLQEWAIAKPVSIRPDGVKKSKYTLVERWTRGIAYLITVEGTRDWQRKIFTNIYTSENIKAINQVPKLISNAIVKVISKSLTSD